MAQRIVAGEEQAAGTAAPEGVRAVTRALSILNAFAGRGFMTLGEIAAATQLDKATTRRLLLTLIGGRFVVQDAATQRYGLGGAIRALSASVVEHFDLRATAAPVLAEIAAELHTTMFVSVYRDGAAVCLDRIHDIHGMEVRWWAVGGTLPLNCGGAPKLLLAFQSPAEIDRMLARPLTQLTPKSTMDPRALRRQLDKIRARGWEFAVDDVAVGLSALAVPVLDHDGTIVGALSMGGLTPQMVRRGQPIHLKRLQAAAETVRARII
jgi:IclR family transcriptional regulator, KDG regulon repressor